MCCCFSSCFCLLCLEVENDMGPIVLQVGSVSIELKFGNLTMCFRALDFWRLVTSMQQHGSGGGPLRPARGASRRWNVWGRQRGWWDVSMNPHHHHHHHHHRGWTVAEDSRRDCNEWGPGVRTGQLAFCLVETKPDVSKLSMGRMELQLRRKWIPTRSRRWSAHCALYLGIPDLLWPKWMNMR